MSSDIECAIRLGWPELRVVRGGAGEPVDPSVLPADWVWSADDARSHLARAWESGARMTPALTFDAAGALTFARQVVAFGWHEARPHAETSIFLLEGLVGADVLADAMTRALEEISSNEWRRASLGALVPFYLLGFVLMRADERTAVALRTRLRATQERRADEGGPLSSALDLVLNGAHGARRSARGIGGTDDAIDPAFALFVDDDRELVRAVVRGQRRRSDQRTCGSDQGLRARRDRLLPCPAGRRPPDRRRRPRRRPRGPDGRRDDPGRDRLARAMGAPRRGRRARGRSRRPLRLGDARRRARGRRDDRGAARRRSLRGPTGAALD